MTENTLEVYSFCQFHYIIRAHQFIFMPISLVMFIQGDLLCGESYGLYTITYVEKTQNGNSVTCNNRDSVSRRANCVTAKLQKNVCYIKFVFLFSLQFMVETYLLTTKTSAGFCYEFTQVLTENACHFCPFLTKLESDQHILLQVPSIIFGKSPIS